jgi:hypothetical protein
MRNLFIFHSLKSWTSQSTRDIGSTRRKSPTWWIWPCQWRMAGCRSPLATAPAQPVACASATRLNRKPVCGRSSRGCGHLEPRPHAQTPNLDHVSSLPGRGHCATMTSRRARSRRLWLAWREGNWQHCLHSSTVTATATPNVFGSFSTQTTRFRLVRARVRAAI